MGQGREGIGRQVGPVSTALQEPITVLLNGQQRAFLLDPLPPAGASADAVPEPGTFAMLGVGGLAWAFCRLRKTLQTRSPDAS